jgi:Metallo-beta-lactamase superfamily
MKSPRLQSPVVLLGLLAILAISAPAATAQPPAPSFPQYLSDLVRLNEDTYAMRIGGYSTLFITTDEGVIVVDPISGGGNSPNNSAAIEAAIATVTDQPVRYMIYSHSAQDHGSGADVFADTAELVGHRNTQTTLAAMNNPRMPAPTIAFDDSLWLDLGGKQVELRWSALNAQDSYATVHYRDVLMAVDNIRLRTIALGDFQGASPESLVAWIERLEADPSWTMWLYGHANGRDFVGTRSDAADHKQYIIDLMAAVRAAQAAGHPDNSEAMEAAVRAQLAPRYGTWANFTNGLAANIRGVIRWWSM